MTRVSLIFLALVLFVSINRPGRAADEKNLDCLIEPHMTVDLSSPVPGVLGEIVAERGDHVNKNQVLARLKSAVEEANVKLARAQLETTADVQSAQARLELSNRVQSRASELRKTKMIPDSEADEADTKKVVAEFDLKRARENKQIAAIELERATELLKQRSLASTISGIIVKRYKSPGDYVEDQPVFRIAQVDPLNVEVIAPLALHGSIRPGMSGEVHLESPLSSQYPARVTIVDTVIDASSGTFGVRLELPNPQRKIPAGVRCSIKFTGGGK